MKIAIVTDSVASIPESILNDLRIHWVPYYIHVGKETWRDLVTIKRKEFYEWLPGVDILPKTASPGPGDYIKTYQEMAEEEGATDIISIHMTSLGSGAYQAAMAAKSMITEKLPSLRINVIDTLNVSLSHGWMVIEAARAALRGEKVSDIIEKIMGMIPKTKMVQTADTLKYLYMGGRIGRAKHLVGSLLRIKPLIGMENGVIVPLGQARNRNQAYKFMCDYIEEHIGISGKIRIAYVHAAARDEALKIKELVEARFSCVESITAELSPALGVHTGPGTAGICYFPID